MTSSSSEGRWATIGKIGVVIAILVGLANLYSFLRPDAPDLECSCDAAELQLPLAFEPLREELSKIRMVTTEYEIKQRLTAAGVNSPDVAEAAKNFAADLAATIQKSQMSAFEKAFDKKRAFVECQLLNAGTREAKDVVFKMPFEIGYAQVVGSVAATNQFEKEVIKLGSVKPGVKLTIRAWSESYAAPPFEADQFLLTYEDGSAKVRVPKQAYGAAAAAAELVEFLTWSPLFFVFVLLLLALLIVAITTTSRENIARRIVLAERRAVERHIKSATAPTVTTGSRRENDPAS